jgi:hypothetical protein
MINTSVLRVDEVPKRDDDDDFVIGNRAMAAFATGEGFPTATASMQKYTSPAINTGPTLIGYYGKKPASTKGLIRAWCRSRIRPRPARSAQPAPVIRAASVITAPVPIVADQPSTPRHDHAVDPNADQAEA